MDTRLLEGIFLGVKRKTSEYLIGTPSGVFRARNVYRRALQERWDRSYMDSIVGSPWQMKPLTDSDSNTQVPRALTDPGTGGDHQGMDIVPRRAKITRADLTNYGYTPGCKGCESIQLGKPQRLHSEECSVQH